MFRLFLIFLLLFNSTFIQAIENRTALVIGNSKYHSAPLSNPKNDAEDFAKVLKTLGFKVILIVDANLREMDEAVTQFGRVLEKETGVGLFFYAGHGVQSDGRNYLIPINSDLNRESDLKYNAMDAGKILDEMGYAKNGLNIAILDACRDNPLSRSFRGGKHGLARPNDVPTGILIAYSTAPGKQASDGSGRNSPYTKALLSAIQEKGQPLELVFKNVIKSVKKDTNGKQIPWVSSSVDGDFYFAGKKAELTTAKTVAAKSANSAVASSGNLAISSSEKFELLYWESVVNEPSPGKYRAYLNKYPNGHFKAIAQTELASLSNLDNIENRAERSINSNLEECNNFIKSYYLTSGPKGNAYDCYNHILKNNPANTDALAGIAKIEQAYINLTEKYLKQKNLTKTQQNILKLEQINASNTALPRLQEQHLSLSKKMTFLKNSQDTQLLTKAVDRPSEKSATNVPLSKEQQQVYSEYKEVIDDLLSDKQYKKAEIYLQKMVKINPAGRDINHYKQMISQRDSKSMILDEEKQQIFDEYRDIVEELLKPKKLSEKEARKVTIYIAKLQELNPHSAEIERLNALFRSKL